jgi:teichuronic acid biosynthesis glycosyltransferase TuaC
VKGVDRLVKVWGAVKRSGSDATLVILGDGPERRRMERAFAVAGLSASVKFLGSRPQDEVAGWMNAADCLCLVSRSEGMPNVVIEAQASGLPVVATDAGACGEMLEKDVASVLVKMAGRSEEEICGDIAAGLARVLAAGGRGGIVQGSAGIRTWEDMAGEVKGILETGERPYTLDHRP